MMATANPVVESSNSWRTTARASIDSASSRREIGGGLWRNAKRVGCSVLNRESWWRYRGVQYATSCDDKYSCPLAGNVCVGRPAGARSRPRRSRWSPAGSPRRRLPGSCVIRLHLVGHIVHVCRARLFACLHDCLLLVCPPSGEVAEDGDAGAGEAGQPHVLDDLAAENGEEEPAHRHLDGAGGKARDVKHRVGDAGQQEER